MIEDGILYIVGLQISISEFLWTIISFFPFMFLLKKILYNPVLNFMDERKARIDEGLDEGKTAARALEENREKLNAELAESSNAAREMIGAARSEADKEKSKVLAAAHEEAADLHKQVQERLKNEEVQAVADIESSMPELVKLLSEKLLHSSEADDDALIGSCIEANRE